MMMAALTFLPCKPFSSPSAEMEKLRELRALCGYKKSLKDALAHTETGHGARSMRQTGKVFQDFSHHEAHRGHEDAVSALRNRHVCVEGKRNSAFFASLRGKEEVASLGQNAERAVVGGGRDLPIIQ